MRLVPHSLHIVCVIVVLNTGDVGLKMTCSDEQEWFINQNNEEKDTEQPLIGKVVCVFCAPFIN
jgi:hypothetical protein